MLKVVELKGTYHEIGMGWGRAFKEDIDAVIQKELGVIADFIGISLDEVIALGQKYLAAAESYDPEFIEVLHGFSEGANTSFEKIFALRTLLETLFYTDLAQGMCTAFVVSGRATESGETIIGQNIDWHPGLPFALFRITWPTGVKQLSLSMGGIWEYSLTSGPETVPFALVATLTASIKTELQDMLVPISIIMSKAARQKRMERSLAEFINNKHYLASFLLASGEGDMLGIELGSGSFEVLCPEADVLVKANHYLSDRFKPVDIFAPFVPDSYLRNARLSRLIEKDYGKITPEDLQSYLADHNGHPKGLCSHVDPESQLPPSATTASVIMVPEKKIMFISVGTPCTNNYVKYQL